MAATTRQDGEKGTNWSDEPTINNKNPNKDENGENGETGEDGAAWQTVAKSKGTLFLERKKEEAKREADGTTPTAATPDEDGEIEEIPRCAASIDDAGDIYDLLHRIKHGILGVTTDQFSLLDAVFMASEIEAFRTSWRRVKERCNRPDLPDKLQPPLELVNREDSAPKELREKVLEFAKSFGISEITKNPDLRIKFWAHVICDPDNYDCHELLTDMSRVVDEFVARSDELVGQEYRDAVVQLFRDFEYRQQSFYLEGFERLGHKFYAQFHESSTLLYTNKVLFEENFAKLDHMAKMWVKNVEDLTLRTGARLANIHDNVMKDVKRYLNEIHDVSKVRKNVDEQLLRLEKVDVAALVEKKVKEKITSERQELNSLRAQFAPLQQQVGQLAQQVGQLQQQVVDLQGYNVWLRGKVAQNAEHTNNFMEWAEPLLLPLESAEPEEDSTAQVPNS